MVKETQLELGLGHLRTRLLVMCASVGIAIEEACLALEKGNIERARSVVEGDEQIDSLENEIDQITLSLMVRNQPVAQDLRFIIAAIRIVGDLERIGDEAVNVAERAITLEESLPEPIMRSIAPLMEMARLFFKKAMGVFQAEDAAGALELLQSDDESTQMEVQALHGIMELFGRQGGENVDRHIMHGILICRSLNRICRRAANIAEQTYFIAQGINLKHSPLPEEAV